MTQEVLLDALGAGGSYALVDGECLLQVGSAFMVVAVLEVALADSFQAFAGILPGRTARTACSVTRAPSLAGAPIQCPSLEPGESRGDGLVRSPENSRNDTAAPGSCGAANRQQRDAPQSAS